MMQHDTDDLNELLAQLREAGQHPERALLDRVKAQGPAAVQPLIAMATDEDLHYAEGESPHVWAPLHAIQILGEMGAAEAVEPLLPLLKWDDDRLGEALPACFGRIGRPALQPLRTFLFDRTHDVWARSRAADGLAEIVTYHPDARTEALAALIARLAPAESQEPDDETLNGLIIANLLDLKAKEAGTAIRRAYEEDRVDRHIVGPESLHELGLPAGPEASRPGDGTGRSLALRCTACGYERDHQVGKVYCDLTTMEQRKQGQDTPYSEFIIPQRITCPKCGAVDQYELAAFAYVALTAEVLKTSILARDSKGKQAVDDEDAWLVFRHFTLADGRKMHPLAARDMYRQQVAADPNDAALRVRYAKVLCFLGYRAEAVQQYQIALQHDPACIEAYVDLGLLAREAGDRPEASRMFKRVLEMAPGSRMPRREREEYLDFAREQLAEFSAPRGTHNILAPPAQRLRDAVLTPLPTQPAGKVGRNDPCPCGSGKKYKKCCGR